jgi:HNH endonuclease
MALMVEVEGDGGADSLRTRLASSLGVLSDVVAQLEPGRLSGGDAKELYGSFVLFERLAMAGRTVLAPRIDASGIWRDEGHGNAASFLASLEGVSTGQARRTLELGQRLDQLPDTKDALCQGTLSAPKATELTSAGVLAPEREAELLSGAAAEPLHEVRDRCQRSRATSVGHDPIAATKRIYAGRHFSSWTDPEGAFCYRGRDTADRGARILEHIGHVSTRLRRLRRKEGEVVDEPEQALRADAFFLLLTGSSTPTGAKCGDGDGSSRSAVVDPDIDPDICESPDGDPDPDIDPDDIDIGEGSSSIIDRPPTCSAMVRIDLDALLRGEVHPNELCEIDAQGPIPVAMARQMMNDSFLRMVFHRAGDIRSISHFGRTINRQLRTALAHRDRTCVVPGCSVRHNLEIDHIIPFAEGGPTNIDNLALLCHHHHFLKTFEGWTLTRDDTDDTCGAIAGTGTATTGGTSTATADSTTGGTSTAGHHPTWRFEPLPPFGQEPDLGWDLPTHRNHRRHGHGTETGADPDPDHDPEVTGRLFEPG